MATNSSRCRVSPFFSRARNLGAGCFAVPNPDDRQWPRVGTVGHVFLFVRLGVAGEQDARRAVGKEDGHRVVVDLGEKTALQVGGRPDHIRVGPNAPTLAPLSDAPLAPLSPNFFALSRSLRSLMVATFRSAVSRSSSSSANLARNSSTCRACDRSPWLRNASGFSIDHDSRRGRSSSE
jgi:hypothetical protein